MLKNQ